MTGAEALPRFGLGGAALGNLYAPVPEADAAATLETAWDLGVRYFDTAPFYGHGLSEIRLGRFLRAAPRPDVVVSSKVGRGLRPRTAGPAPDTGYRDTAPFEPYFDYSREAVLRQVEASLARLGRERLDIAFVHDIGALTHGSDHAARMAEALDGAFPALVALREAGVVGAIGVGVNEVAACLDLLNQVDLDVILLAGRYSLLDAQAGEILLPLCQARDVRVVIGGPYNSGVLAGGGHYDYRPAAVAVRQRVARLEAVCRTHGVALPAAALAFPLRHPAVASVIPGARSPTEVRANHAYLHNPPPQALWDDLRGEGLIPADTP